MEATTKKLTVEEYYAISVEGDRTQLVEGEIIVNEPMPRHAVVQGRLYAALHAWAEAADGRGMALLPTSVALDEHNSYGPDVLWFKEERRLTNLDQYPQWLPDLCVEVRSPNTWRYDIGAKKNAYERGGLAELWLVDTVAETVLVYRRSKPEKPSFDVALELAHGEKLTSPHLPDFELALERLFASDRPGISGGPGA